MIVTFLQESLSCRGCGSSCGLFTAASGTISDGSGQANYPNYANCRWLIAPSGATQITLAFSIYDIENNYDFVRVFECSTIACVSYTTLAQLTGRATGVSFTSTTGFLLVQFTSDYLTTAGGFTASWTVGTPSPTRVSQAYATSVFASFKKTSLHFALDHIHIKVKTGTANSMYPKQHVAHNGICCVPLVRHSNQHMLMFS